jgi:anti-sigma regulatory factor (Ser/Thr protein kinase)
MEKRILIARWLGSNTEPIPIYDEASVSSARQRVRETGRRLNLQTELIESVAVVASELTHNQLSHAKQGYFAVKGIERGGVKGLEVLAADIGPGIGKPDVAFKDEMATSHGSLGAGLGAVARMSDEVDFDNRIEEGVCIVARKFERPPISLCCDVAIMGRPFPGEGISGDDAVAIQSESMMVAGVSDGLGHGPEARVASNRSIETLIANPDRLMHQAIQQLDEDLAGTRGCAMSVLRFNKTDRMLECASLGDVHVHLYHYRDAHFFPSTPLILGSGASSKQKIRLEAVKAEPGAVLIMFTDGLKSRTSLKGKLDILRQPAIAIAQNLIENDSRPDDDALVMVARFRDDSGS